VTSLCAQTWLVICVSRKVLPFVRKISGFIEPELSLMYFYFDFFLETLYSLFSTVG